MGRGARQLPNCDAPSAKEVVPDKKVDDQSYEESRLRLVAPEIMYQFHPLTSRAETDKEGNDMDFEASQLDHVAIGEVYQFHPLKSVTESYNQGYDLNTRLEKKNREENKFSRKNWKRLPTKGSRLLATSYKEKPRKSPLESEGSNNMPVFPNFPQIPRTKKPKKPKIEKQISKSKYYSYSSQEYPHQLITNIADLVSQSWTE